MRNLTKLFLIVLTLSLAEALEAQSITWQRMYGNMSDEQGSSIVQTFDGNYVMCGFRVETGCVIIKVDEYGDTIWSRAFSESYPAPTKIIQTKDNNLLISGFAREDSGFYNDGYLLKIDQDGNLLWDRKYGFNLDDNITDIFEFSNGDLCLAGGTQFSILPIIVNSLLIRTNSFGDILWQKVFDSTGTISKLDHLQGKGILLSGKSAIFVDTNGIVRQMMKNLHGIGLNSIEDDGYTFINRKDSIRIGIIIFQTDTLFNKIWEKYLYLPDRSIWGYSLIKSDQFYVIGGLSLKSLGETGNYLTKINIDGLTVWEKEYFRKEYYNSGAKCVSNCQDKGFITIGQSKPYGGQLDFIVMKTDSSGNTSHVNINLQESIFPEDFVLNQNYPNPFNSTTLIEYSVRKDAVLTLKIYNSIGKLTDIVHFGLRKPGNYTFLYNGDILPSGVYYYSLMNMKDRHVKTKKFLILK